MVKKVFGKFNVGYKIIIIWYNKKNQLLNIKLNGKNIRTILLIKKNTVRKYKKYKTNNQPSKNIHQLVYSTNYLKENAWNG